MEFVTKLIRDGEMLEVDVTGHDEYWHVPVECISELIKELSRYLPQEPQANLNFWEAYQAMKRGEWVGNEYLQEGTYLAIVTDGEGKEEIRHFMGFSLKVLVTTDMLNSTAWYIVPKDPRYKVGDRFEILTPLYSFRQIVEVIATEKEEYAVRVTKKDDGSHLRFQTMFESQLNEYSKLSD